VKTCESCGKPKPEDAARCPSCGHTDREVMQAVVAGTLAILILALLVFWIYRFGILGWAALPGNLRIAAFAAGFWGLSGMLNPTGTFGVGSRWKAAALLFIALVAYLVFNLF